MRYFLHRQRRLLNWVYLLCALQATQLVAQPSALLENRSMDRSSGPSLKKKNFYQPNATKIHFLGAALGVVGVACVGYWWYRRSQGEKLPTKQRLVWWMDDKQIGKTEFKLDHGNIVKSKDYSVYAYLSAVLTNNVSERTPTPQDVYKVYASSKKINQEALNQAPFTYCKKNQPVSNYLSPFFGESVVYIYVRQDTSLDNRAFNFTLRTKHLQAPINKVSGKDKLSDVLKEGYNHINISEKYIYTVVHQSKEEGEAYALKKRQKNDIRCWGDSYTVAQLFIDSGALDDDKDDHEEDLEDDDKDDLKNQQLEVYLKDAMPIHLTIFKLDGEKLQTEEKTCFMKDTFEDMFGTSDGVYFAKRSPASLPKTKEDIDRIIQNPTQVFDPKKLTDDKVQGYEMTYPFLESELESLLKEKGVMPETIDRLTFFVKEPIKGHKPNEEDM